MVISKLKEINESIIIGFINNSNCNKKNKIFLIYMLLLIPEKELF